MQDVVPMDQDNALLPELLALLEKHRYIPEAVMRAEVTLQMINAAIMSGIFAHSQAVHANQVVPERIWDFPIVIRQRVKRFVVRRSVTEAAHVLLQSTINARIRPADVSVIHNMEQMIWYK